MYRLNIVNGIIRSIDSFTHFPDYEPQEGEIFCQSEVPVPSTPVYGVNGNVIGATPVDRNIPYTITKNQISTTETTRIETVPNITVVIDGEEYFDPDGVVEYSNANTGTHQIILKGYDYFYDTVIEVEVV